MNFAMATLGLKEMGKFLQPKVAKAKSIGKMQKKKSGIMKSGLDAMPIFLLDDLLSGIFLISRQSRLVKNYTVIYSYERIPNGKNEEYKRKCHMSTLFHFITFYLWYF